MTDEDGAADALGADRLDAWLDDSGFVDVRLGTWLGVVDETDLDDPWADAIIELPTLTPAQRSHLFGDIDDRPSADDVTHAEAEIIEIPSDPDDIAPFEP